MTPICLAAGVSSHFSLLEAVGSPEEVARRTVELGYTAALLADRQTMAGALQFLAAGRTYGIRALVGVETGVAGPTGLEPVRIIVRSRAGWASAAGVSTRPTVEWEALAHDGLAVLFLEPPNAWPVAVLREWAARAGGLYYLAASPTCRAIGPVEPVAGAPARYLSPEDREAYVTLVALGGGRPRLDSYLRPAAEWVRRFGADHPAIRNWARLVESVDPDPAPRATAWLLPAAEDDRDGMARLSAAAWAGLATRLGGAVPPAYGERLQAELAVIGRLGFAGYFLLVGDLAAWARSQGIGVGPGRGSVAASLTAWALGITEIDPVRWNLVFERFLNPARQTPPDIDLDVEDDRREAVLTHLEERYGRDRVALIGTFGSLGARAALREVGRVLGVPAATIDRAARAVPAGPGVSLAALMPDAILGTSAPPPLLERWWTLARRLEGTPRHVSTHAAGVVVAPKPLTQWTGLRDEPGHRVTDLDMHDLEALGLVKLDVLGLRTLSVIRRVRRWAPAPPLPSVPEQDEETLELLGRGDTEAVFQLDGRGVKDLLRRLRPRHVADVMVAVALFRPGPMDHIETYLARRGGAPSETDEWGRLFPDTYGVLVFQEQLMAAVRALAGYSWAEADLFRRAVSKKDRELLRDEEARFVERVIANGRSRAEAEAYWRRIFAFADYGFNRAHATAYGWLAYYVAFLKAHWPVAFWASELTTRHHGAALGAGVRAAWQEGVPTLPADINVSGVEAVPDGDAVRLGLAQIRGVGETAAAAIVSERERGGPFRDGDAVADRLAGRVGETVLRQLAAAGALVGLPAGRWRPTRQVTWFDEAPDTAAGSPTLVNDEEGWGFSWPRDDGHIYVRHAADIDIETAARPVAAAFPGSFTVIAVRDGERRGRRTGLAMDAGWRALRALKRVEGVRGAVRGVRGD